MLTPDTVDALRSEPLPNCRVCDAAGVELYQGLQDRLFGVPGVWNLKQCPQADCGLLWLDPMPTEEDLPKAYQTYYTHQQAPIAHAISKRIIRFLSEGYLAGRYGYRNAEIGIGKKCLGLLIYLAILRRPRLDFRLMHLPVKPGGRLLEVGCGNGEMLQFLREAGWQTEGVDFDATALTIARDRGLAVHPGTVESQGYTSDTFDAITSSHTIEHLPHPAQFLRECHRILKPRGQLVIVTPNSNSLCHRFFKQSWHGLDPPRHLYIFNTLSLQRLFVEAGFRKIRVWTSIRDADRLFAVSQSIRLKGQHIWGSPQPLSVRLVGTAFQFVEYLFVTLGCKVGEEIVVIAEK
jgi:2-polyprenyl-3-methyl-5-hydroxy-6-metoxy-1,4-benzoquinol methylase